MELILFRGRPGTGKTFLSQLLSQLKGWVLLSKDDIYDSISILSVDHQLRNKAVYGALYAILKSNTAGKGYIVLDFPFQFDDDVKQLENWCIANKVDLKSILVTCSDEQLWATRFNKRAIAPKPNQLITNFEELKKRYPTMYIQPGNNELLIDTAQSPEGNLTKVMDFINC